jgi:hypothetical protein
MSNTSPLPAVPGLILRLQNNTLYFVPAAKLEGFRLPDALQPGSADGSRAQAALDHCGPTAGVKNALMTKNGIVTDTDAGSPTHGKEKFAPGAFEAAAAGAPQGGKEKFAAGIFGDVASAGPQGGKEKFQADTTTAGATSAEKHESPGS